MAARDMLRLRRLPMDLLLVTLGLVAAAGIGEVVVRLLPQRWVPELAPPQQQRFYLRGLARRCENRRLHIDLVPDNPSTQVNAAGYRGTLYPEKKPPGVERIVGIGDSSMYGWGVPEQHGYLRQLELLLLQACSATVQAVNLAVPGYNSEQELEVLRTRALRFDPDLIVLGYDHNDAEAYDVQTGECAPMPEEYGQNALHSELLRLLDRKFYGRIRVRPKPVPDSRVGLYLCSGSQWDRHLEALFEFARLAHDKHIPVVVVVHDAYIRREDRGASEHYRRLHVPLDRFWKQCGFHPVDCYDLFQEYMRSQDLDDMKSLWVNVFWEDFHPNARAHRMIAAAVLRTIQESHLLPSIRQPEGGTNRATAEIPVVDVQSRP